MASSGRVAVISRTYAARVSIKSACHFGTLGYRFARTSVSAMSLGMRIQLCMYAWGFARVASGERSHPVIVHQSGFTATNVASSNGGNSSRCGSFATIVATRTERFNSASRTSMTNKSPRTLPAHMARNQSALPAHRVNVKSHTAHIYSIHYRELKLPACQRRVTNGNPNRVGGMVSLNAATASSTPRR